MKPFSPIIALLLVSLLSHKTQADVSLKLKAKRLAQAGAYDDGSYNQAKYQAVNNEYLPPVAAAQQAELPPTAAVTFTTQNYQNRQVYKKVATTSSGFVSSPTKPLAVAIERPNYLPPPLPTKAVTAALPLPLAASAKDYLPPFQKSAVVVSNSYVPPAVPAKQEFTVQSQIQIGQPDIIYGKPKRESAEEVQRPAEDLPQGFEFDKPDNWMEAIELLHSEDKRYQAEKQAKQGRALEPVAAQHLTVEDSYTPLSAPQEYEVAAEAVPNLSQNLPTGYEFYKPPSAIAEDAAAQLHSEDKRFLAEKQAAALAQHVNAFETSAPVASEVVSEKHTRAYAAPAQSAIFPQVVRQVVAPVIKTPAYVAPALPTYRAPGYLPPLASRLTSYKNSKFLPPAPNTGYLPPSAVFKGSQISLSPGVYRAPQYLPPPLPVHQTVYLPPTASSNFIAAQQPLPAYIPPATTLASSNVFTNFGLGGQQQVIASPLIGSSYIKPTSATIRTVQIVNTDQVKTIKVLESLDTQGVKTIKILGASSQPPTGNHRVVKVVSGPGDTEQTVRIFNDQQDVSGTGPSAGEYLPPERKKRDATKSKLQMLREYFTAK